jgi:hypothetical protein
VPFDHGFEFVAYAVADRCRLNGTDTVFTDPGSPWRMPESSHSTMGFATIS